MPLTPLPRDKGRLKLGGRSGNRHAEGTAGAKRDAGRTAGRGADRDSGRSSSRAAKSRGERETERASRANDFLRRFHPVGDSGGGPGSGQSGGKARNARRGEDGPSLLSRMGAGLADRAPSVGGFLAILAALLQIAFAGLVVVATLCVITLGLFVGYRWTTSLERFAVREVVVQGAVRQTEAEVLAATGVDGPTNLLELNLRDVEAGVAALPWTESVSVRRELPDKLLVSVVEKTPVFFVQRKEGIFYADALGRVIAPVPTAGTTGAGGKADDAQALREALPRLEMGEGAERFATALPEVLEAFGVEIAGRQALRRALPPVTGAAGAAGRGEAGQAGRTAVRMPFELKDVALIRLSAKNGLEFTLDDPPVAVSLGAVDWRDQLPRVAVVLEDLRRRGELDRVAAIRAYGEAALVERLDKVDRPENRLDRLEVQTEPKPQTAHAGTAQPAGGGKPPQDQKPGGQKPGDQKPDQKFGQTPGKPPATPEKTAGAKVR